MTGGVCDIDKEQLATRAVIVRSGDREMELELCEYHYNQLREQQADPSSHPKKGEDRKTLSKENFEGFVSQMGYLPRYKDKQKRLEGQMSEQTKAVVQQAAETAVKFGKREIDTEHFLHALAASDKIKEILQDSDLKNFEIRSYIETHAPRSSRPAQPYNPIEITVSPHIKQVVDTAMEASDELGHNYIGPEHLLIGLAEESKGMAGKLLREHGLTPQTIRQKAGSGAKR